MKAAFRQRRFEEEEESAFISMTDMTVSFLFIVMIMLAFFATQIAPGETVPKEQLDQSEAQVAELQAILLELQSDDPSVRDLAQRNATLQRRFDEIEAELTQVREALQLAPGDSLEAALLTLQAEIDDLHRLLARTIQENPIENYNRAVSTELGQLLVDIRQRILEADGSINVTISNSRDALHFTGDGLFLSGASTPTPIGRDRMRTIAIIIDEEIGCFTFGGPTEVTEECNPGAIVIEAIQVEGHTDTDGGDVNNMGLSANRAAAAFGVMVSDRPGLLAFRNLRHQPVLSVAGYGEGRTIADESQPGGKDSNRRIDIRFIMYAPVNEASIPLGVDDLVRVRDLLARVAE